MSELLTDNLLLEIDQSKVWVSPARVVEQPSNSSSQHNRVLVQVRRCTDEVQRKTKVLGCLPLCALKVLS